MHIMRSGDITGLFRANVVKTMAFEELAPYCARTHPSNMRVILRTKEVFLENSETINGENNERGFSNPHPNPDIISNHSYSQAFI